MGYSRIILFAALAFAVGVVAWLPDGGARHRVGGGSPPLTQLIFGAFAIYGNGSCGSAPCIGADTFANTWGNDGVIYIGSDDTYSAWNNSPGTTSNILVGSIDGYTHAATGTTINVMANWGTQTQCGSDNANYKLTALSSIGGTLILGAVRQNFGCASTVVANKHWFSTQFIKSADHGVIWTPNPPSTAEPYASPMFSNPRFAMPTLIQNGQDYTGPAVDRMNEFVYGLSADQSVGHYDPTYIQSGGSDQMFLGRVAAGNIANLSASDWTYYQGGDGNVDGNWGGLSTAVPVLSTPGQFINGYGSTVAYLPAFRQFILIESYPGVAPTDYSSMTWNIFSGNHPWGPWTLLQTKVWNSGNPQGPNGAYAFYFPMIVLKSLATDGGRTLTLLTAGDFTIFGYYTLYMVPVTLQ